MVWRYFRTVQDGQQRRGASPRKRLALMSASLSRASAVEKAERAELVPLRTLVAWVKERSRGSITSNLSGGSHIPEHLHPSRVLCRAHRDPSNRDLSLPRFRTSSACGRVFPPILISLLERALLSLFRFSQGCSLLAYLALFDIYHCHIKKFLSIHSVDHLLS